MRSFNELLEKNPLKPAAVFPDEKNYFAHTGEHGNELLTDHIHCCQDYFLALVNANSIEEILDGFFKRIAGVPARIKKEPMAEMLKLFFLNAIIFHDAGKVNPNFQFSQMGNQDFQEEPALVFGTRHSRPGAIIFAALHMQYIIEQDMSDAEKGFLICLVLFFCYTIDKHHGKINDGTDTAWTEEEIDAALELTSRFKVPWESLSPIVLSFLKKPNKSDNLKNFLSQFDDEVSYDLHALLKLHYGLLTSADYYATIDFTMGIKTTDFGLIDQHFREKLLQGISDIWFNQDLDRNFNKYKNTAPEELLEQSTQNQGTLRQILGAEMISTIRNNPDAHIYYLEAPTGAGKTNLSLLFIREMLNGKKPITKVFYIFPLITVITQTAAFIREHLKLDASELAEIHSKALPAADELETNYGRQREEYLDGLFLNFPFILMSHVKFFAVANNAYKEELYLLPRLANSVVIIDELQSYSPETWDKIYYLLSHFAEKFNIIFLLMSATLPKITRLTQEAKVLDESKIVNLISNKKAFFNNPNFAQRVTFRNDYLTINQEFDLEGLASTVAKTAENYFSKHGSAKGVIEFITIKRAHQFFEYCSASSDFYDYEIFILSSTILEPRRKQIINYLKSANSAGKKILLVTTQVVEAGVDIDMDFGFKDIAIPDSEEQLAGRINRNAGKKDSVLYLFNTGDRAKVYGRDRRLKLGLSQEEHLDVLQSKNFDFYYEKVIESINKDNKDPFLGGKLGEYKTHINNLNYAALNSQLRLIEENSIRVFVPLQIINSYFEEKLLAFLSKAGIETEQQIDGTEIFKLYEKILRDKTLHFLDRTIQLKLINPVLAQFTFSLHPFGNNARLLKSISEERSGFFFLPADCVAELYSFETGLKSDLYENSNFL